MTSDFMRLLNVIPLTHVLRPAAQIYSYFALASLPVGAVVTVPLGRRKLPAVVASVESFSPAKKLELKRTPFQLRPAQQILTAQAVIDEPTLNFLAKAAAKTAGALSLYTKTALPPILFKNLNDIPKISWQSSKESPSAQEELYFSGPTRLKQVLGIIQKTVSENRNVQILIVVPWLERRQTWQVALSNVGLESHLFDPKIQIKDRWRLMTTLASGETKMLIGPRSALFLPYPRLGLIVVDEAQSDSYYAFDQQPYYDTRVLARLRAIIQGAALAMAAPFPPLLNGGAAAKTNSPATFKAKFSALKPPYPAKKVFSPPAQEAIADAIMQSRKILLYLNRRGEAPLKACPRCGFAPRCAKCRLPLAFHTLPAPALVCHHCGAKSPTLELCPQCRQDYLKPIGLGTQALEKTVRALWPAIPCFRLDADTAPNARAKAAILASFNQAPGAAILLGTAMVLTLNKPVALAVAPRLDLNLFFPNYRAVEETFLTIGKLYDLATKQVVIQTLTPQAGVFALAKTQNIELFLRRELGVRSALGFPPALKMAKVTFRGASFLKVSQLARAQIEKLNTLRFMLERQEPGQTAGLEIIGPIRGFYAQKTGAYELALILKFPLSAKAIQEKLLEVIHPRARVAIDPPDLLA